MNKIDMKKAEEVKNYFKQGSLYTRQEIHSKFKGNSQSGFSISPQYSVIFIFTSEKGKEYGYEDGWMSDNLLHIAGEGQIGDMKFTRGNKAIRDHTKDKRLLLYFEQTKSGKRKYFGEIQFNSYYQKDLKDKKGNLRKGIIFKFQSAASLLADKEQKDFEKKTHREGTERRVIQTVKERNSALRKDAILKYGTRCLVCGFDFDKIYGRDIAKGYIEVHHEKMLADIKWEREVTVDEVKVVCSNCHRMIHRKKDMLDWNLLKDKVKIK